MTKRFMLTAAGMALCAGSISAIQVNDKYNPTDADRDAMDHLESRDSDYIEERNARGSMSSDCYACCLPDGTCFTDCTSMGSAMNCYEYGGDTHWDQACEDITCEPAPLFACCLPEGGCEEMAEGICATLYGSVFQEGLTCNQSTCTPECDSAIFSNHAYPLEISCGATTIQMPFNEAHDSGYSLIDLDGDGAVEQITGSSSVYRYWQEYDEWGGWGCDCWVENFTNARVLRGGSSIGTIEFLDMLDLHPNSMIYDNFSIGDSYSISVEGWIDVTGDGLVDALIRVSTNDEARWFYAENISSPPAVACASDTTGDGVVNVNDLIAMIADWGPCE